MGVPDKGNVEDGCYGETGKLTATGLDVFLL